MAALRVPQKVLLLSCGSFNPVTHMHLRIFELARDVLQKDGKYEVVGGIMSPTNDGYTKKGLIASKHRVKMCQLATISSKWIRCNSWEAEQPEWQTTVTVINRIQNMITNGELESPVDLDAKVKFLCGADLLESFAVPNLWADKDIETILGYGLVVITRAGSHPEEFIQQMEILKNHKSNIHLVNEWVSNEISATKIKAAVSRGDSIKYLVPDPVIDYIDKHQLYR